MNDLKFSRFLLISFTGHLLLALGISLYYSTSYISIQPIKTKIYFQKLSKIQTNDSKSEQEIQKLSSNSNFKNNLASSLKQLNLEADKNLLQEVQEELNLFQEPDLKNIQLNQPTSPGITNNKKTTNQSLAVNTETPAVDFTQQNNDYKKLIGAVIQNNWKSSFGDKGLQVIIQAKILKNGVLDDVKVVRSSQLPAFEAFTSSPKEFPFPVFIFKELFQIF